MTGDLFAVYDHFLHALFHMVRILHADVIDSFSVAAGQFEVTEIIGNAGIDAQSAESGIYAQNILGDIGESPGCGSGQPAVLAFSEVGSVGTCHHLGINIRLCLVDLAELFNAGRACLPVNFKRSVAASHDGLRNGYPGIVVAEDTGIFFVSRRIGRDLAEFYVISGISGLQESNTVFGIQDLLNAVESGECLAGFFADAGQNAEALGFDEDLTLFTLMGTDLVAVCVICAYEPFAVPAVCEKSFLHDSLFPTHFGSFLVESDQIAERRVFLGIFDKHASDKDGFRHRPFAGTGGLEGLSGVLGEAVEIQAVVPVRAPDQRKTVGALVSDRVVHTPAQVLHKRLREGNIIIEGHGLIQNRDISGLADISADSRDEPERIIVEAAADVGIPLLGEGLILMIGASVRELCGGDIDDPLPCAFRHQMHKAQQILTGIAESHSSSDPGFKVGSASGHVEGDHALILVPDIDHPVHFGTGTGDMEFAEQLPPIISECLISGQDCFAFVIFVDHCPGAGLIDHAVGLPFLFDGILHIGVFLQEPFSTTSGSAGLL